MNAHNIAIVFAPNMTQMVDLLTALMYAVQVMNFLKTLTEKRLRKREASVVEQGHFSNLEYSDYYGHHNPSQQLVNYLVLKALPTIWRTQLMERLKVIQHQLKSLSKSAKLLLLSTLSSMEKKERN